MVLLSSCHRCCCSWFLLLMISDWPKGPSIVNCFGSVFRSHSRQFLPSLDGRPMAVCFAGLSCISRAKNDWLISIHMEHKNYPVKIHEEGNYPTHPTTSPSLKCSIVHAHRCNSSFGTHLFHSWTKMDESIYVSVLQQ